MDGYFDQRAAAYDDDFSKSLIGRYQRKRVWDHMSEFLSTKRSLDILEVNCGTGVDAIQLADNGHRVLATDQSEQMIDVARKKTDQQSKGPEWQVFDLLNIHQIDGQYDLLFSNFGGLNCISPDQFRSFFQVIPDKLKPGGRFIAVIMPEFCWLETLYFLLKLKPGEAFRRKSGQAVTTGRQRDQMKVWYYSPSTIRSMAPQSLQHVSTFPIGLFLPPSYLKNHFEHHQGVKLLYDLERLWSKVPLGAGAADHFYIEFIKA